MTNASSVCRSRLQRPAIARFFMNRIAFLSFFVVTALLGRAAEQTAPKTPPTSAPAPVATPAPAEAPEVLKLTDGRVLVGWRIVDESPEYVTVRHKAGISKVSKKILPEPVRSAYPIDKEAAAAQRAADEAARKEREQKALGMRMLEEKARQEQKAQSAEAAAANAAFNSNPNAAAEAQQRAVFERVFDAAKVRAKRYFTYEFEPSGSSRIYSINVAVDADDPEPWPGIPGRYTVKGKGYLQYYSRSYSGFDHATKEWIAYVDVTTMSAKVVDFRLR